MNMEDALNYLRSLVQDKEWYYAVKADKFGRLVVYTLWQSGEILKFIPSNVDKYQVLVHFAISTNSKDTSRFVPESVSDTIPCITYEDLSATDLNISLLIRELDKLEKICGSHTLQDIFYEVQDGKNAVTDMSKRYPEVRKALEGLFLTYGFDVIYEEIDG